MTLLTQKPAKIDKYPLAEDTPRKPAGRKTKYKRRYCQEIITFFARPHFVTKTIHYTSTKGKPWTREETTARPVPLMCEFAHSINVYHSTVLDWVKQVSEFHEAFIHAQTLQLAHLNAVTGTNSYNSNWAIFMAKNTSSWRDKKDIEHSGGVGIDLFVDNMINKADEAANDYSRINGVN